MPILSRSLLLALMLAGTGFARPDAVQSPARLTSGGVLSIPDAPFGLAGIDLPTIPGREFNIQAYGATGDGMALNTTAIQAAISTCSRSGGGRVIIPSGVWLTGPLKMESRVELHLESGALLLFSADHSLYPVIQTPSKSFVIASPLYGFGLEDIAITGPGIMDGAGESWRPVKKNKTTASQWNALLQSGGAVDEKGSVWWPSKAAMMGEAYLKNLQASKAKKEITAADFLPARDFLRPYMISFIDCKRVVVTEVTIRNSPKFALCPAWCDQLVIQNIKVNNEWWAQNGDGIDISACRHVLVEGCTVSAGDDGICMKSSARRGRSGPALEKVIVRDCIVYRGHGGFVVGSNTEGGMRDLLVENCTFIGTDIGLRFKSARGRGGAVENIRIRKIRMSGIVNEAIHFDTFYETESADTLIQPVTAETPLFRGITMEDVRCASAARAIVMAGLPEQPIQDIVIRESAFTASRGISLTDVSGLSLTQVRFHAGQGPLLTAKRCSGITIDGVPFSQSSNARFGSDIWRQLMHHDDAWFATAAAGAAAEQVLLYQCPCGGWPKNIDMVRPLTPEEKRALAAAPPADTAATIDNGATWTQLLFLARVNAAAPEPRFMDAFKRGLNYLLTAQYPNGGWPQFYPLHQGYYSHITYNDDAMIGVLTLLKEIADDQPMYRFIDQDRRRLAAQALERGIGCILKTQLTEGGKRTSWCAQYDEHTLAPAAARTYELVSLSGEESVGIVRFLMSLDHPDSLIAAAIQGAVAWFEQVKITGIRVDHVADASSPYGYNKVVVADSTMPPMWARFYIIGSNRPFFSDRDGRIHFDLAEISSERRNKYAWLGYWPQALLEKEYPAWHARYAALHP